MIYDQPFNIPLLVLTGPVGVGKTSVAAVLSDLLAEAGMVHAVIDLDWLRWCRPSPPSDPFHTALGLDNLAMIWRQYQEKQAERLILVDILESPAMLDAYRQAIPGARPTVVRLHAELATIHARLERREIGASLEWHRRRAAELSAQMERDALEDVRIATDDKTLLEIAWEVVRQTGWVELAAE